MGRRERKQLKRAVAAAKQAAVNPPVPVTHATQEEANAALSETAKVINMKQKQDEKAKKKGRLTGLPALPKLPKKAKNRPEHPCECGCETPTRARFAPGHDSYIRGWAIRVERKIVKIGEVPDAHREAVKTALKERAAKAKAAEAEAEQEADEVEEQEVEESEDEEAEDEDNE